MVQKSCPSPFKLLRSKIVDCKVGGFCDIVTIAMSKWKKFLWFNHKFLYIVYGVRKSSRFVICKVKLLYFQLICFIHVMLNKNPIETLHIIYQFPLLISNVRYRRTYFITNNEGVSKLQLSNSKWRMSYVHARNDFRCSELEGFLTLFVIKLNYMF